DQGSLLAAQPAPASAFVLAPRSDPNRDRPRRPRSPRAPARPLTAALAALAQTLAPHGPPRRPRPHPASVWPPRTRAVRPGGAMSVLPRMGQMRFLLRPRGPRSITPGAPPSRRANAASTRPSRGDIFTEQLAGHFHWTATVNSQSELAERGR